ncbi:MAG: hypothetical protein H0T78_07635 [Longispora sp.]|nr:hypothetical protein [Longispora sp. (in: high G+C Gram-positive bacteria)]
MLLHRAVTAVVTSTVIAAGMACTATPTWAHNDDGIPSSKEVPSNSPDWNRLPSDIWNGIFTQLPIADNGRSLPVCRAWNASVKQSEQIWKQRIPDMCPGELKEIRALYPTLNEAVSDELLSRPQIIAGNGKAGFSGGDDTKDIPALNLPYSLGVIGEDEKIMISDWNNRRLLGREQDGTFRTLRAGDPLPLEAEVHGLVLEDHYTTGPDGGEYRTEIHLNQIQKFFPNGQWEAVAGDGQLGRAGGDGSKAPVRFSAPTGLAVGPDGTYYVSDSGNHRVVRIDPDGTSTTIAGSNDGDPGFSGGDGSKSMPRLQFPVGVAIHKGVVYIADAGNHRVLRVNLDGTYTTVAGKNDGSYGNSGGDGSKDIPELSFPSGLAIRPSDEALIISDSENHRVLLLPAEWLNSI